MKNFHPDNNCPVRNVLCRLGDKWSMLVLITLNANGTMRFCDIHKTIADISQRMLTVTLRTLETDGLVSRKVYAEVPPRVEYELTERGKIVSAPMIHPLFVLLLVGFANASFCKLFGGDLISMGIVFSATITGFYLKQQMQKKKINHYITFIVSAFVASLCASTALIFDTTSEIALATSVLYLVPGVPLINGVIDVVEGYVLTGFARLTEASLLIVSIAIGLSFTLLMVKNSLI